MSRRLHILVRWILGLCATIGLVGAIGLAHAAGTPIAGQIGTVLAVGSADGALGIGDFRVYLVGNPVICNGSNWAYTDISDANYQVIVANILTAKATAAPVTLYWIQDSVGNCEITFVSW